MWLSMSMWWTMFKWNSTNWVMRSTNDTASTTDLSPWWSRSLCLVPELDTNFYIWRNLNNQQCNCYLLDEINFRFAWHNWWTSNSISRGINVFFWFLDQNVDNGLFRISGLLSGDLWCRIWWGWWSLDENDFVMFLVHNATGSTMMTLLLFWLWGWDMYVDVFLDNGCCTSTGCTT